jgi:hypothetical protein
LHSSGDVDINVVPEDVSIVPGAKGQEPHLRIVWATGGLKKRRDCNEADTDKHESIYPLSWLYRHSYSSRTSLEVSRMQKPTQPFAWMPSDVHHLDLDVAYSDLISPSKSTLDDDDAEKNVRGYWKAVHLLSKYGLCFVRGVPKDSTGKTLEKAAEKFGPIQETFYGRSWDVVAKKNAENIAYTQLNLNLHMDLL